MSAAKEKEPIELRKILNPSDNLYEFVSKVRDFLGTKSKSHILNFILTKSSKIPFEEFIQINH